MLNLIDLNEIFEATSKLFTVIGSIERNAPQLVQVNVHKIIVNTLIYFVLLIIDNGSLILCYKYIYISDIMLFHFTPKLYHY